MMYKLSYYIQTNLLCILALVFILVGWLKNTRKDSVLGRFMFMFIGLTTGYCISDVASVWLSGNVFTGSRVLQIIANSIYFYAVVLISAVWLLYVTYNISAEKKISVREGFLIFLPAIIFGVILIINAFNGMMFTISEDGIYKRGKLVFLHYLLAIAYLLFANHRAATAAQKQESRIRKKELLTYLYFGVAPFATGIIQILCYGLTTSQIGLVFSLVLFYQNSLNGMVNADALTGLNNRRAFDAYIERNMFRLETKELSIMMMDIDRFKSINDRFGHMEGDAVLRKAAAVLQEVCANNPKNLFLSRFGGDEFIIAGYGLTRNELENIRSSIDAKLCEVSAGLNIGMPLSMSIGYATGSCHSYQESEQILAAADSRMYDVKIEKRIRNS